MEEALDGLARARARVRVRVRARVRVRVRVWVWVWVINVLLELVHVVVVVRHVLEVDRLGLVAAHLGLAHRLDEQLLALGRALLGWGWG